MKKNFKLVSLVAFTTFSFCVSAQTNSAKFSVEGIAATLKYVTASHSQVSKSKYVFKNIDLGENLQEAEILGDVTLILTNGPQNILTLKESSSAPGRIKLNIKNGRLIVDALKETGPKNIIYLSVAGVSSILMNGNSEIFSSGTIITNDLQIVLNGTSMVSVKYHGKLNVVAGERAELIDTGDYNKLISRK